MIIEPVGVFRCREQYPYDAPRQGEVAGENAGLVELYAGHNFEQALQDLEGFSRIWLLFQFHVNANWKPLVLPPRGKRKVGVFASRAPYRPNGIGISCVKLVGVRGLCVAVCGHDLLDGTPILDIKPYLPYADSFPDAVCGWVDALEEVAWAVRFSQQARAQLDWLKSQGVDCLERFLCQQLSAAPFDARRKRLRRLDQQRWEIAYRTWRACFKVEEDRSAIVVEAILSGYRPAALAGGADRYGDKGIHKAFEQAFGRAGAAE